MKLKSLLSIPLSLFIAGCGVLSESGPTTTNTDLLIGGVGGALIGGGVGAAIGSAIDNGNIGDSALLGAGVGLAVGTVGVYAYKEIKIHNTIKDNDTEIECNRQAILNGQLDIDAMREEVLNESYKIRLETERENPYDGPTLGVYYR